MNDNEPEDWFEEDWEDENLSWDSQDDYPMEEESRWEYWSD